ncbi:MAG: response regulator transcription factor [Tissierellia bacterium]|nr:response regulator transcription factor [Tissierellia bacterium]
MARILVIDDEPDLLILIRKILEQKNHRVDTLSKADDFNEEKIHDYDLILLDIMMPGTDGINFCKTIRPLVDIPILFLTAKTQEQDIVEGLISGGDDYIKKPFGNKELLARVDAHLRREEREKFAILNTSGLRFNLSAKEVHYREEKIPFTKSEYEICEYLAKNKGQVFSREQIHEAIYGYEHDSDISAISEHIKNIRSKLFIHEIQPIETVWGIGYKWI